ncbi:hypothetical protein J7T55_007415 [Diaporthe amygdali]|uniref:uncharacterized protein n=1 Tax=Phomopsis amygdali TaxID=1214568 RepID=UPI0022FEDA2D|nr:uncharacterized protein J7T55_007415 [Diaporthe amygdali]KAJ0116435.1 hypothetical protein J7T55_007415 [Diaporthe amygdali]
MKTLYMDRVYPKAFENRHRLSDPKVRRSRIAFFKAAGKNFTLLQVLFLGLFCWVFAALFQQTDHAHKITVALVDYDGGAVGLALREAYARLEGNAFPTLVERDPGVYSSPAALEDAVCRTEYWAALYVARGSSDKLQAVLNGDSDGSRLDRSDILTYIWNEARYSSVVDAVVSSSIQTLASAARVAYTTANGTGGVRQLSTPEAISVFAEPWQLTSINIQPTTQGSRAIYNTLVIIFILIQEFFYLGTLNGLYVGHKLYVRVSPNRIVIVRDIISILYCLIGALCTTGAIWAFRSGWDVEAGQFMLNWMTLWLFAHVNFLQFDIFTIWLPPPYIPMALISWVLFNVTSILLPFELSPGFFRIGYAAPAHEVYQVLIDIWSRGCNPQLYYALPILFAWWVWGLVVSALGVYRRCHYAVIQEDKEAQQFQERLEAAVQFERQRDIRSKRESTTVSPDALAVTDVSEEKRASGAEANDPGLREQLAGAIRRQESRAKHERGRESRACSFGPAFSLPFPDSAGSESDGA